MKEYLSMFERTRTYSKKHWKEILNELYKIREETVMNIYGILNKKEESEIIKDFKKIYTSSNGEITKKEYKEVREK